MDVGSLAAQGTQNAVMGGVGAGLLSFADTYMRQKQLNTQNAQNQLYADAANRREQAGLLSQGMETNDLGNVQYNDEYKQLKDSERQQQISVAQLQQRQADPNSNESQSGYQIRHAALEGLQKGLGDSMLPKGLSEIEYQRLADPQIKAMMPGFAAKIKGQSEEQTAGIRGQYQAQAMGNRQQSTNDRLDERVHQNALNDVNKDPNIQALQTSYQNLATAKNNFENGGATPQDFAELQQAVRANLGIKGSSGVGERQEDYLKSIGINVDKAKQFISGDPQDVSKSDPALVKQMMGLVDLEMANKQKYAMAQIDQKAAGHQAFYQKPENAERLQDFQNVVNMKKSQFGIKNPNESQTAQGQGLLGAKASSYDKYPIGTTAKAKDGTPVIYKGNGVWQPQ